VNQIDLQAIAANFDIRGRFMDGRMHGSGHINDTFAVRFDDGGNRVRHVLQRVNQTVFKNVPALMENVDRATRHISASLERQDIPDRSRRAMTLIRTRDGSTYHVDPAGEYWRAYQFVEGATSYDLLTTHDQAYEVARAFGTLQTMLADLPEPPLHETIAMFHDGPERFRAFVDVLERDPLNRAVDAGSEIAFLMENAGTFDRFPALLSSGAVPLRVTHNDCKSNNVLIDDATGEGICVIDLDTLMPGLVLYDFGDMVRTGTCPVAEDSRILDDVRMDLERFKYLTHGYLASAGEFLTSAEREQLVFAGKVITLMIGARFLTDYLQGDTYFKTHRPDHNLDRCRVQFALVRSISNQESAMHAVVDQAAAGQESSPQ
jgi:aminoglycoside phosphotransferase (APT) family kinase protein